MQHPPLLDVFPLCEPFLKRGCTREACSYTHAVICDEAVLDRLREKPWLLCSQWAFGTCTTVPCPRGKVHPAELAVVRPARVVPPTPPKQSSAAKAKERDNSAGGHFSWTAMDYLAMDLKGLNARNAYLNALLHGELATSVGARLLALAREEACCRQFVNHKTLKKELSEALSALRLVALALEKMDQRGPSGGNPLEAGRSNTGSSNTSSSAQEPGSVASVIVCPDCTAGGNVGTMVGDSVSFTGLEHSDGGSGGGGGGHRRLCVIDVCSGKGFFAAVCTLALQNNPSATVCMVDSDQKMVLRHLSAQPFQRIAFHALDVHSEAFEAWLLETCASAVSEGAVPVVVGLHLCGRLSTRLTALFSALPSAHPAVLVLSPCCLPHDDHSARDQCRAGGWDPYNYWCRLVFGSLVLGVGQERGVVTDEHVLSPKSTLIWSIKGPVR
mmetsp:Transcript_29595/g.49863  ORF Transcript_29595/g.49863 Transcript_29595/m.49863 type:complete len:442 (-) Transcript_29595:267-1592(-)